MITMISKAFKAVGFPNKGAIGDIGTMKLESNPIVGSIYYFQPKYKTLTRKDRRRK